MPCPKSVVGLEHLGEFPGEAAVTEASRIDAAFHAAAFAVVVLALDAGLTLAGADGRGRICFDGKRWGEREGEQSRC
jgi:hypothetical protein